MLNFIQDQQLILPVKNTFRIIKSTAPCFRIFQGYVFVLWKKRSDQCCLARLAGPGHGNHRIFFCKFQDSTG